jgi:hypothetical protein
MIPAHSVFHVIHIAFYSALPVSVKPQVCAKSPTPPIHGLTSFYDRLSRSIRDEHWCSLTWVALSSRHLFEPFLHSLRHQFLIQYT